MTLLTPAWLWLLLPWTALLVYLLRAAGPDVAVPFVELWKKEVAASPRRSTRLPPLSILLLMGALLLAILAATQPVFPRFRPQAGITVIVDAGSTMSTRALRQALDDANRGMLDADWHLHRLNLIILPGDDVRVTDVSDWTSFFARLEPTATDTRPALNRAIRRHLAISADPLLVVSNQSLSIDDPRLVHIMPATPIHNAGIEHLGISLEPRPQAMVRLLNQSPQQSATLRLHLDDSLVIDRPVDLPPSGESAVIFIDLPAAPRALRVELLIDDDLPHDNRAHVQRRGDWPRLVAVGVLPPELSRMLEVYARHRPPGPHASTVAITTDPARLPATVAGAVALAARSAGPPDADSAPVAVTAHALTREIDWGTWLAGQPLASRAAEPLADDLQALVTRRGRTLLAIREAPARQVWLALDTPALADTPEYVILWTNILTWLGGDGVSWQADATARLIEPVAMTDWRDRLIALSRATRETGHLAPVLLITALAAALAAIALLPPRRSA